MMRVRAKNSVRVISAIVSAAAGAVVLQSSPAVAFKLSGPAKIAFIYENQAKDGGWDESLEAGRDAVQSALGVPTSMAENIPEDASKIRAAIDLYVKRGFNVIVGTTYGYSAPFAEAAKAYPKIAFLNASGTTNGDNLESFYARTYQGWYLAGIAAGYATHSQKVGMLAGFPIGRRQLGHQRLRAGRTLRRPKVEGIAVFTNSWWDPVKGRPGGPGHSRPERRRPRDRPVFRLGTRRCREARRAFGRLSTRHVHIRSERHPHLGGLSLGQVPGPDDQGHGRWHLDAAALWRLLRSRDRRDRP